MKQILNNMGYFLKEARTVLRLSLISNLFSLLSIGLIFFILAMVTSGWWISNQAIDAIKGEAEIDAYYQENLGAEGTAKLVEDISAIAGVREVHLVNEAEAYNRMVEILGKDARVLAYLGENPFSPFIEVNINLEQMEGVMQKLEAVQGIEHIRDNRQVLDRLQSLAAMLKILGSLIIAAVGVSTLIIIGHIIRLGIYNNREQINTLRLLGAPERFIAFPFVLVGLALTMGGGLLASLLSAFTVKYIYVQMIGPLPFIPLPPQQSLIVNLMILMLTLGLGLGILGSIFGLSSNKNI